MKPLRAARIDVDRVDRLRYPLLASHKIDGIRCLVHPDYGPVSRKFKEIPNEYIRSVMSNRRYRGLDCELVCLDVDGRLLPFDEIQSQVMARVGEPRFMAMAFDRIGADLSVPFRRRLEWVVDKFAHDPYVSTVLHWTQHTPDDVRGFYREAVADGCEGVMLRDPDGVYKFGTSTLSEQLLIKIKERSDDEGVVVGFEELRSNKNPPKRNRVGAVERRGGKKLHVKMGVLGALIVRTRKWGDIRIGSGFTAAQRGELWRTRKSVVGRTITFHYQSSGMKNKPRHTSFKGFRED
jgi:DNA ligase 1